MSAASAPPGPPLKALSLWRPWPYVIFVLGKDIENRSNKRGMPPPCRHRGNLLLHAAKSWDFDAGKWCLDREIVTRGGGRPGVEMMFAARASKRSYQWWLRQRDTQHPTGLVGRCRVVGHVEPSNDGHPNFVLCHPRDRDFARTVRVGDREVTALDGPHFDAKVARAERHDLRWWMGDYALLLADRVAFAEAIATPGQRGLWDIRRDPAAFAQVAQLCAEQTPPHSPALCWCGLHRKETDR